MLDEITKLSFNPETEGTAMFSTNLVARALVLAGLGGALPLANTARAQSPTAMDVAGNVGLNRVCASGTFSMPFGGVAANGKDLQWTGAADGGVPGEMRILLADKGPAGESNRPVWGVVGVVFVSCGPEDSFTAAMEGIA